MDISILLFALLAFVAALAIYTISIYNRLQRLRNGAEAALSQIQVAMKKRLDMIEQLVDSVRSYARFERETLESITEMRSSLKRASPHELSRINGASHGLLGSIQAAVEAYPDLKTSDTVVVTMSSIRDVEDEISRHRYTYNNIIQEFNTMLDTFPSSLVGSTFRMADMEYLSFEEDELRNLGYLSSDSLEPRRPEAKW